MQADRLRPAGMIRERNEWLSTGAAKSGEERNGQRELYAVRGVSNRGSMANKMAEQMRENPFASLF
jgi:hypothetical protein